MKSSTALLPVLFALAMPPSAFAQGEPTNLAFAQLAQAAPAAAPKSGLSAAERVAVRINELHAKLRITADQETLWAAMAQTMQDNEMRIHDVTSARSGKLHSMTAIEDLKSYQVITDEHADGLRRLIPTFEALYAAMPPAQQKNADHVFDQHAKHSSQSGN